jgi:hypothetical protein
MAWIARSIVVSAVAFIPYQAAAQNRQIERQLDRGNQQMIDMTQPRFGGSPPFPLFRCDGQRAPIFGAENCPNWQLHDLQMKVLKQQYELQRRQLQKQKD